MGRKKDKRKQQHGRHAWVERSAESCMWVSSKESSSNKGSQACSRNEAGVSRGQSTSEFSGLCYSSAPFPMSVTDALKVNPRGNFRGAISENCCCGTLLSAVCGIVMDISSLVQAILYWVATMQRSRTEVWGTYQAGIQFSQGFTF